MPPFKKKRRSIYPVLLHEEDASKGRSYINLTIVDSSSAVYNMVHASISEKQQRLPGPEFFKKKVAHKVAKKVSTAVPPSAITKALSAKLPKMLMYKMYHNLGMRLAAQAVYREDCYAVIQIQVQYVDSKRLLAQAKDDMRQSQQSNQEEEEEDDDDSVATAVLDEWIEEQKKLLKEEQESPFVTEAQDTPAAAKEAEEEEEAWNFSNWREVLVVILAWILTKLMPVQVTRQLEEKQLPSLIQSQISKNLKAMLDKKLASKSLQAETAVLPEAEQARYFFAHLQKVRSKTVAGSSEQQQLEPASSSG